MANEAQLRISLLINNQSSGGQLVYQSFPQGYTGNVVGNAGPVPGAQLISNHGTQISFPGLTLPGYAILHNLDPTNFVTYGIWIPSLNRGIALGELLPGEIYVLRFSRYLGQDFSGGTGSADAIKFWMVANSAPCWVDISAFEH